MTTAEQIARWLSEPEAGRREFRYTRAFAEAWPDAEFAQQAVAQLPSFTGRA